MSRQAGVSPRMWLAALRAVGAVTFGLTTGEQRAALAVALLLLLGCAVRYGRLIGVLG